MALILLVLVGDKLARQPTGFLGTPNSGQKRAIGRARPGQDRHPARAVPIKTAGHLHHRTYPLP